MAKALAGFRAGSLWETSAIMKIFTYACRFPLANEDESVQSDSECASSGFLVAETKDI